MNLKDATVVELALKRNMLLAEIAKRKEALKAVEEALAEACADAEQGQTHLGLVADEAAQ